MSVIQAGTPVHKTHNSAITVHRVHLVTAYVGIKEFAVTKEFCKHSLPVVKACNLPNHFYIQMETYNFQHANTNASYTYKIIKIHFKSQNSKS
jgi:hypothetical protein